MKLFFLFCTFLMIESCVHAQNHSNQKCDSLEVAVQLSGFVKAFEYFDSERFQSFFADDVTVFFPPSALVPNRIEGKKRVMEVFENFFFRVKQKVSKPPYLQIAPENLHINIYQGIAIITFELDDKDALSRRTIVMKKINGKYLIIHLHASKIDIPSTHN